MEALPLGKQDFSLVLGGPLYQLFRRAHLSGPALEQLWRRLWVITLVAWLPLLVLSAAAGQAVGPPSALPFLRDIEAQVRFLVALPVMIAAELIVHQRTRGVVAQFLDRGVVRSADRPRFDAALASALRLRNSLVLEVGLLVLVATAGHWIWRSTIAFEQPSWHASPGTDGLHLTAAGVWYAAISLPITQFILLRWYLRLFVWFRFLWQVSRLDLHLDPHPSGSDCRIVVPGQEHLCLRAAPLRAGCDSRRHHRHPGALRRPEPPALQARRPGPDRTPAAASPRTADRLHSPARPGEARRARRVWEARQRLRQGLRGQVDPGRGDDSGSSWAPPTSSRCPTSGRATASSAR